MWHGREYRITQANRESRLQLEPFKFYLVRRRLGRTREPHTDDSATSHAPFLLGG
jgi:hypothetical protein